MRQLLGSSLRALITAVGLAGLIGLGSKIAFAQSAQQPKANAGPVLVPNFRHIDPSRTDPDFKAYKVIRFVVTDDFPPFSFKNRQGALTGFNVSVANAVCNLLRVECRFVVKPFGEATKTLQQGLADALVIGLRRRPETEDSLSFTRPYFRFSARFAVRTATPLKVGSVETLAGKRIGVVQGTYHAAYIGTYFFRSKVRQFDSQASAYDSLRTGAVDAVFDDSIKLMFWMNGSASKHCCRFAGPAYFEPATFSPAMSIAVKKGNETLRKLLDHGLDRLQVSGRFARIYRQYFPASMWRDKASAK